MSNFFSIKHIHGTITVPGDKSMSHRSIMLSALASNKVRIENLLESEDVLNTIAIFKECGIPIEKISKAYYVNGKGLFGLAEPKRILDVGNSGTTLRLMCGILGPQRFYSILTGDNSILNRPVKRVIDPLTRMNVRIFGRAKDQYPPVTILPSPPLNGLRYTLPIPSAQIKSAILFAGLYAKNKVVLQETIKSRNHTENLFHYFNIPLQEQKNLIILDNQQKPFKGKDIVIPGDFSSAAFFLVAALIAPNSRITITDVGMNPTRTGLIQVLKRMGARISITHLRKRNNEEIATLSSCSSEMKGTEIQASEVPFLIDEIPILAIAALKAQGMTILRGARELRVKESDRIKAIVENLKALGANVKELEDGFVINGEMPLNDKKLIRTYKDHRIAMSFIMASLLLKKGLFIDEIESIKTSFPNFIRQLNKISS